MRNKTVKKTDNAAAQGGALERHREDSIAIPHWYLLLLVTFHIHLFPRAYHLLESRAGFLFFGSAVKDVTCYYYLKHSLLRGMHEWMNQRRKEYAQLFIYSSGRVKSKYQFHVQEHQQSSLLPRGTADFFLPSLKQIIKWIKCTWVVYCKDSW